MLGLGNTLIGSNFYAGSTPDIPLEGDYVSDFSSSVDGWTLYSFANNGNGTLTFGESIGGRDNCLKLLMNGDETSGQPFGIYNTTGVTGEVFEVGDTIEYSYEFYSNDVSPPNDDPAGEINVSIQFGAGYHNSRRDKRNLNDGVWHTISGTKVISGGANNDDLLIYFGTAGSNPSTGDSVYFRNIVINHYKPQPIDLDGITFLVQDFYDDDHIRVFTFAAADPADTMLLRLREALNYDSGLDGDFDGAGDKMPGTFTVVFERFSDTLENGGTAVASSTGTLQYFRLNDADGENDFLSGYLLESTAANLSPSTFDTVGGSELIDLSAYGNNDVTTAVPYFLRATITYNPEAGSDFISGTSAVTQIITVTNQAP